MSVVNQDWRNPTAWAPAAPVWAVVRDGDRLHLSRRTKGGTKKDGANFSLPVQAFLEGQPPFPQLQADLRNGAVLAAGLDPTAVVLRTLRSPLADAEKSAELWPGLLDAALPFPLEDCMVVFSTPRPHPDGGWVCDAFAARRTDLEAELLRWSGLKLDPALLLPEAGLFAEQKGLFLWRGEKRALAFHRNLAEDAACVPLKPEGPAFLRFCLGRGTEASGAVSLEPGELAGRLAEAVCAGGESCLNLRAESLAQASLQNRYQVKQTLVKAAALLLSAGALLLPAGITRIYRGLQKAEQTRIASTFRDITGQPASAQGQERLLAERWLTEEGGAAAQALETLLNPLVSTRLGDVLRTCQLTGAQIRSIQVDKDALHLVVLGPENSIRGLEERLRSKLARLTREALNEGEANLWLLRGEGGV